MRPALCAAVDYAILLLLTLGLLAAVGGAFALTLPWWLWPGAAALCAVWLAVGAAPLGTAARRGLLVQIGGQILGTGTARDGRTQQLTVVQPPYPVILV